MKHLTLPAELSITSEGLPVQASSTKPYIYSVDSIFIRLTITKVQSRQERLCWVGSWFGSLQATWRFWGPGSPDEDSMSIAQSHWWKETATGIVKECKPRLPSSHTVKHGLWRLRDLNPICRWPHPSLSPLCSGRWLDPLGGLCFLLRQNTVDLHQSCATMSHSVG